MGPFSVNAPKRELLPGPPLSQIMSGMELVVSLRLLPMAPKSW